MLTKNMPREYEKISVYKVSVNIIIYTCSDTLLLADLFESFQNKCTEIYEFDLAYFLSKYGFK